MAEFDQGVILRAHQFRAEVAGYRLERGHYMSGEDDPADRIEAAADEAERLAGERGRPTAEAPIWMGLDARDG